MTTFTDLLRSGASLDRIGQHLDNLSQDVRTAETMALSRGDQKKLFEQLLTTLPVENEPDDKGLLGKLKDFLAQ